jgi:hypothetical protein
MKIFVWTKAKNKTTDITGSSITINNGDSFRVYVKTYHESNRNDLPLSPSGRKPFSNTDVSCSYGNLSGCNYLRRTPDAVSNINGPSQIQYSINGTVGYNIKNQLMTGELNSLNEVNKIYTFNILPEIFIPLSNRKQTINISATSKEYNGYVYDNSNNKPLCTSVTAKINIDSISSTVGGENQDNESIDNTETGIE